MKITIETITGVVNHVTDSYDSQLMAVTLFFLTLWVITLFLLLYKNKYMLELEGDIKKLNRKLKKHKIK